MIQNFARNITLDYPYLFVKQQNTPLHIRVLQCILLLWIPIKASSKDCKVFCFVFVFVFQMKRKYVSHKNSCMKAALSLADLSRFKIPVLQFLSGSPVEKGSAEFVGSQSCRVLLVPGWFIAALNNLASPCWQQKSALLNPTEQQRLGVICTSDQHLLVSLLITHPPRKPILTKQ